MSAYDKERAAQIAMNKARLAELLGDLPVLAAEPQVKKRRCKPDPSKKRGAPVDDEPPADGEAAENEDERRPKKLAKIEEPTTLRRSARNRGKELNYNDNGDHAVAASRALPRVVSAAAKRAGMEGVPRDSMKRTHDP